MTSFAFTMPTAVAETSAVQGEMDEVLVRLAARMKQNITTGDRRRNIFKKYSDCFTGMEAVDWMLEQMEAKSVAEAVRKGQGLLTNHYIEKVERELKFEYSKKRFYRFTPTTPEFVQNPERPLPTASLDLPLSSEARRRAFAAIIGGFVADAASTALNGVSHPEKMIPNLLRLDFDPAFCGQLDTAGNVNGMKKSSSSARVAESSTGFEARIILQCIARRGQIHGSQLAKDAYWGLKSDHRLLSSTARAFIKRIHAGKTWPHCAVKCRSIDILSLIPIIVALYAGTNSLFPKVDELVNVFYSGQRVRDAALVAAFVLEQVILGASVLQAMRMSIRTERLSVKQRKVIFKAFTKSQLPSYEAIQKFGNKGALPGGLRAVLQPLFVLSDYPTAVRENIIGGGRTCRRAMFIGACFAAQDGLDAIPEGWIKKTQYYDFIEADAKALIQRREIQGSFIDEEVPSNGANVPYVDYPHRSSLSSRPSNPQSQRRSDNNSYLRHQHSSLDSRGSLNRRHRSGSFNSNSSSPRSIASNYSYNSQTTTASSVRSVIDLGDMDKFYQSHIGSSSSSSRMSDSRLSFEMHKFFQMYGGGNGSVRGSDPFTNSGRSTMRSSDSNPLRPSDFNPFFQSQLSNTSRRSSEQSPFSQTSYSVMNGSVVGGGTRSSESNLMYHNNYSASNLKRASDPHPFYQTTSYVADGDDDDVVLAHRVSLDQDQRLSLHAIL